MQSIHCKNGGERFIIQGLYEYRHCYSRYYQRNTHPLQVRRYQRETRLLRWAARHGQSRIGYSAMEIFEQKHALHQLLISLR
jgi:hypothetical protein